MVPMTSYTSVLQDPPRHIISVLCSCMHRCEEARTECGQRLPVVQLFCSRSVACSDGFLRFAIVCREARAIAVVVANMAPVVVTRIRDQRIRLRGDSASLVVRGDERRQRKGTRLDILKHIGTGEAAACFLQRLRQVDITATPTTVDRATIAWWP